VACDPILSSRACLAGGGAAITLARFILETDRMPREDFACTHRLRVLGYEKHAPAQ
jgi:hypothetical protein